MCAHFDAQNLVILGDVLDSAEVGVEILQIGRIGPVTIGFPVADLQSGAFILLLPPSVPGCESSHIVGRPVEVWVVVTVLSTAVFVVMPYVSFQNVLQGGSAKYFLAADSHIRNFHNIVSCKLLCRNLYCDIHTTFFLEQEFVVVYCEVGEGVDTVFSRCCGLCSIEFDSHSCQWNVPIPCIKAFSRNLCIAYFHLDIDGGDTFFE